LTPLGSRQILVEVIDDVLNWLTISIAGLLSNHPNDFLALELRNSLLAYPEFNPLIDHHKQTCLTTCLPAACLR
jgi:hypothetical protein